MMRFSKSETRRTAELAQRPRMRGHLRGHRELLPISSFLTFRTYRMYSESVPVRQAERKRPATPDRREPAERLCTGSRRTGARIVVGAPPQSRDFSRELRVGSTSGCAREQADFRQGHLYSPGGRLLWQSVAPGSLSQIDHLSDDAHNLLADVDRKPIRTDRRVSTLALELETNLLVYRENSKPRPQRSALTRYLRPCRPRPCHRRPTFR